MPDRSTSRYGSQFDVFATRWAALENEHDLVHPNRSDCGGVGGCSMMRHANDLEKQMLDALDNWRASAAAGAP